MFGSSFARARALVAPWAVVLAMAALAGSPGPARGQDVDLSPVDSSLAADPPRKHPFVAAALQAAFPPLPLGYLYAGDLQRGLLPTGLMIGGSTVFLFVVIDWVTWNDPPSSPAFAYAAMGAILTGYVWGILGAADAARDANAEAEASRVTLQVTSERGGVFFAIQIPFR